MGGAWKEFARERLPFVAGSLGLNGLILFLFAIAFGHKLPPPPEPVVLEVDIVELPPTLPPEPEPVPELPPEPLPDIEPEPLPEPDSEPLPQPDPEPIPESALVMEEALPPPEAPVDLVIDDPIPEPEPLPLAVEEEVLPDPQPGLPVEDIPEEPAMEDPEELPDELPDTLEVPLEDAEPDLEAEVLPVELLETTPDESVEDLPESIPDEQPEEIPEDLVEEIEPEIEPVEETLPPVPDPVVEPDPEMEPVAEAPLELEPQPEPVPEVDLPDVAELEPDPDEAIILPEPSDAPLQTLAPPVQQPATTAQPFARPQPFGRPPPVRVPGIEFSLPPATAGGGGSALGALLCHKLTEEQRLKANCDLDATKQAYKDAANAGLDRDEQNRLDGTYDGQLRSTLPDDSAFESFLKRNDGIPKTTLDGIDNTIFMDRKPVFERQHDQLMRGDTMEWEDEVFEAHQDED